MQEFGPYQSRFVLHSCFGLTPQKSVSICLKWRLSYTCLVHISNFDPGICMDDLHSNVDMFPCDFIHTVDGSEIPNHHHGMYKKPSKNSVNHGE